MKAFRRFNVVGGFDCVVGVESDDKHCVSFGCVVVCHASNISIVSSFVKPLRHLLGEKLKRNQKNIDRRKSILPKGLRLTPPPPSFLSTWGGKDLGLLGGAYQLQELRCTVRGGLLSCGSSVAVCRGKRLVV